MGSLSPKRKLNFPLFLLKYYSLLSSIAETEAEVEPEAEGGLGLEMDLGLGGVGAGAGAGAGVEAGAKADILQQLEAKYSFMLFKQQLIAYVEKMYVIIRENLKKELEPLLALCIQAPSTFQGVIRSGQTLGNDSQFSDWQGIVDSLDTLLNILEKNYVPPSIVQKIFVQSFSYINVQLFNSLLQRWDCCSYKNGKYVKTGLAMLELWCRDAKEKVMLYSGLCVLS
ncbi:hypothetical protein L2E82_30076 [Cichorium intybus]|uniref:Uncharacterized protein n=1 Tax=Cichorium intybus TaxID=13427 RepID=A0ACB9CZD7_CICIN|nr:hypothetical protein L2E82_30076 [Cichorium intybus]